LRERVAILVSCPTSVGIDPVKELMLRERVAILVRCPTSVGIDPVKELL
jgi:hypothetical protein